MSVDESTRTIDGELWEQLRDDSREVDGEVDGWRIELAEHEDNTRWMEIWRMVVSFEDKYGIRQYWEGDFKLGLTEYQEHPSYAGEKVPLRRVYKRQRVVTITEFVPASELGEGE